MVILVLYPVIKCIRLADTNKPGMDRLWYYVRLTSDRVNNFADEFDSLFDDSFFLDTFEEVGFGIDGDFLDVDEQIDIELINDYIDDDDDDLSLIHI